MEIQNELLRKVLAVPFGWDIATPKLLDKTTESAEVSSESTFSVVDEGLSLRAGKRLVAEEINKQKNIEDVVRQADDILQADHDTTVRNEETDQGWVAECLDGAGRAYNDDLKAYWAKLLAGEIKQPGTYSLRTVDILKKLTKKDAEKIRELCRYVMYNFDKSDCIIFRDKEASYTYSDMSFLMELGLLNSSSLLVKQYKNKDEKGTTELFFHGDVVFFLSIKKKNFGLPIYSFTRLGVEILSIVDDQDVDVNYLREFARNICKKQNEIEILGGHFVIDGDTIRIRKDESGFTFPESAQEG